MTRSADSDKFPPLLQEPSECVLRVEIDQVYWMLQLDQESSNETKKLPIRATTDCQVEIRLFVCRTGCRRAKEKDFRTPCLF